MKRLAYTALAVLMGCGSLTGNEKADPVPIVVADPNAVALEGALGNELVPSERPSEVIARLRISTRAVAKAKRPPINLALVVDTSGSMEGRPIEDARAAALAMLDELEPGDQLAVVAFHSQMEVLVPTTRLDARTLETVRESIGRMQARGTTDMYNGLAAGLQQAYSGRQAEGVNRIVLLSDGVPNDGTQIVALAQNARNAGVSITALGLGLDYDETLLSQVAQASGGTFHYVDDSAKVARVFRDEVLRIERVVARGANVTFVPGPGIEIAEVVGQQAQPAGGRALMVHLGDISEGDEREVVLRLQAAGRRTGAAVEILDAVLRFQDSVANAGVLERRVYLSAHATDDAAQIEAGRNASVEQSLERARAAAVMVLAIAMAREGRVAEGQQLLEKAADDTRVAAERFDDRELERHADAMLELQTALPSVAAQPAPGAAPVPPMAPEAAAKAPSVVRESHDRAMRTLQGH